MKWLYSLALLVAAGGLLLTGCNNTAKKEKPKEEAKEGHEHGHDHPDKGPHGGNLVEWGEEEYHVELVRESKDKKMTAYIFDGEVKKAVPIEAATLDLYITQPGPVAKLKMTAEPQKEDPAGQSSRFVASDDRLGSEKKLKGELGGTVQGKRYDGSFDESHSGHSHD